MVEHFEQIDFYHIPREDNRLADALSTLSSMFHISGKDQPLIKIESRDQPIHCCALEVEQDGKPWYYDIKVYIQKYEYPIGASKTDKRTLRRLVMGFSLDGDVLYKRNHDMNRRLPMDIASSSWPSTTSQSGLRHVHMPM
ncbi:PREDICTED: uncharacterized protein LOC109335449 [Lupinus angustifolius]|uniref:uncharacterized protein LOC109335449 n=1 Tax=Lupinus angustifolius TaxID=3871 RepID=UPI00092E9CC7|nr:PREDICTED: uncharacterized protein LOC109335449 [Lupinus angustifolius]